VNYYEHHIGDYAEATSHLSFVEDAAYSRLIRKYYSTEKPLPRELAAVERLVGARTPEERAAVKVVLEEFFALADDGWRNKRCDEELSRYHEKRTKARRSANARWHADPSHSDRSPDAMRSHTEADANAQPSQSDGNALQSPDTRHQTPESEERARAPDALRPQCDRIDVSRGTTDAGTALTGMSTEVADALAETLNAWRDVDGVDHDAMTQWLAHWCRVHAGRHMPGHQRIAVAKLMAGLGDSAAQLLAVQTAEANGWKALRPGDGRKPIARKGEIDPAKQRQSEQRELLQLKTRAIVAGCRAPRNGEDVGDYRVVVERAETAAKDRAHRESLAKRGPQPIAKLLGRTQ
jgi:uncharacterized protein YdaU (DUF1376 family)